MLKADSTVVPMIDRPTTSSSTKLRSLLRSGFGRLLRGTRQIVFIAFCAACATPRPP